MNEKQVEDSESPYPPWKRDYETLEELYDSDETFPSIAEMARQRELAAQERGEEEDAPADEVKTLEGSDQVRPPMKITVIESKSEWDALVRAEMRRVRGLPPAPTGLRGLISRLFDRGSPAGK